jgi:hypothetical protein
MGSTNFRIRQGERSREARIQQTEVPKGVNPLRVAPHPRHNSNKQTKDTEHRRNQEKALYTAYFVCFPSKH